MKKVLCLILVCITLVCLSGCDTSKAEKPGEVVKTTDKFNYNAGETFPIEINGHKKYLWMTMKRAGIADDDDCPCHEERFNRLLDSIRAIIKEEVRVRLILGARDGSDTVEVISTKQNKK